MRTYGLFLFSWLSTCLSAQNLNFVTELQPLPEPVSNNAVAAASLDGNTYLYSFCGIDTTKKWSGIHLKAWRMNVLTEAWESLPDVPDPEGGKIAAAASRVKDRLYVIGGYHVAADGSEKSSRKVHRFDVASNAWLPDGADIPKAIDDQVQAVWRDSLLFVVTGWSNTQNVPDVQIYNPATDTWAAGTPVPNNNSYKAFGASGSIIKDTIYYLGGASGGSNFPASSQFRKGIINPNNPLEITWSTTNLPAAKGYRMAAGKMSGHLIWVGGSDVTYNYNGIAYNGSGGVPALSRIKDYYPGNSAIWETVFPPTDMPPIMDLRGSAQVEEDAFYTIGGMGPGQQVSNKVYQYAWAYLKTVIAKAQRAISVFPNPANGLVRVDSPEPGNIFLVNAAGQLVLFEKNALQIDVSTLKSGVYTVYFENKKGAAVGKVVRE